ncbi:MAG TPA: hypothetical protein VMZ28_08780 [Kofleriaceae bacterium]|nr:hypothetical protein [Kofleriaceae bacterium]
MESRVFRWSCLGLGGIVAGALLWMLNDVRGELKRTNAVVAQQLPTILENVKQGTQTLAQVSKDIDNLRNLLGAGAPRDRSMVMYADEILDYLDKQPGQIGLSKLVGKGLKDLVPVAEWVTAARKEALWLTFRAASKAELAERLAKNRYGSDWYYAPPTGEPVKLAELIQRMPPGSSAP